MSSLKCPQCGLTNFATAPACKRCKLPFDASAPSAAWQPAEECYSQDGYEAQPRDPNYDASAWRDGSLLVTTKDARLPGRCVKCNAPASTRLKRTVEWYPRYVILVFILVHIAGIILYLCTRKSATLSIGLCESHFNRRRFGILIGCAMLLTGLFVFFGALFNENFSTGLLGLVLFLTGMTVAVSVYRTIRAAKIEEPYVWLKGVHRDFLNTLPAA